MTAAPTRRRSQIAFALLCLLLVLRMPTQWLVEESPSVTVGIEAQLALDTQEVRASEPVLTALAMGASANALPALAIETNDRLIEYSILRL